MTGQFVQADPNLCISCMTCMANCFNKHDVEGDVAKARLNVAQTLAVSAPIACHHCVDAPCVKACPEDVLYHDEAHGNIVNIRQERCIGCRNCVQACPFGAVEVYPIAQTATIGGVTVDAGKKSFLIKCDLCYDRDKGPACVEACPTTALRLVEKESLEAQRNQKFEKELGALTNVYGSAGAVKDENVTGEDAAKMKQAYESIAFLKDLKNKLSNK